MSSVLIDTNVVLRLLLNDHSPHHTRAVALFEAAERGELRLVLPTEVLMELIYVLDSFYGQTRAQVVAQVESLLLHSGIKLLEDRVVHDAIERFRSTKIDLADCLLAARGVASNHPIASFDKHMKKFEDIELFSF